MERLSYELLEKQGYGGYLLREAPERILQFGEGNFLRAFVDCFIDIANEKCGFDAKTVIVSPTGRSDRVRNILRDQDGLYTLLLRGKENGKRVDESRVISCVSRCLNPVSEYDAYMDCAKNPDLRFIVSNTTEAGIRYDAACMPGDRPAGSFPGKLTQFLYARYQAFGSVPGKGFVILACELIDGNGQELKKCVLQYARQWGLGEDFLAWLDKENLFCSTLVDRIVTGWPADEAQSLQERLGYRDGALDVGETFALWVIEGPESLKEELPFVRAGLPVLVTADHRPYKQRKVRILNGAHTAMVAGAYLAGQDIVRDCMEDDLIRGFMEQAVYREIIPTLALPEKELTEFAAAVTERFSNPFIDHALLAITLNSTSKWKARVLPSLRAYLEKYKRLPECLTASLAFYLAFYRGIRLEKDALVGVRPLSGGAGTCQAGAKNGEEYQIRDDCAVLEFFYAHKEDSPEALTHAVLSEESFWGEDLTRLPGLEEAVTKALHVIRRQGARALMEQCLEAGQKNRG